MQKKQQESDNYLYLISSFSDFEKYTLMEYADNDYNKVVFFNPKNSDLCSKLLNLVNFFQLNCNNYRGKDLIILIWVF